MRATTNTKPGPVHRSRQRHIATPAGCAPGTVPRVEWTKSRGPVNPINSYDLDGLRWCGHFCGVVSATIGGAGYFAGGLAGAVVGDAACGVVTPWAISCIAVGATAGGAIGGGIATGLSAKYVEGQTTSTAAKAGVIAAGESVAVDIAGAQLQSFLSSAAAKAAPAAKGSSSVVKTKSAATVAAATIKVTAHRTIRRNLPR